MSGHSKWSSIKRKKGANDEKRGRMFAKLLRAIEVAAREGGPNVEGNMTLASAVEKARDYSVLDRIGAHEKHGWNSLCGDLDRLRGRRGDRNDNIDLAADQIGCHRPQPVIAALRTDRILRQRRFIVGKRETNLLEVVAARRSAGAFSRRLDSWQHESHHQA